MRWPCVVFLISLSAPALSDQDNAAEPWISQDIPLPKEEIDAKVRAHGEWLGRRDGLPDSLGTRTTSEDPRRQFTYVRLSGADLKGANLSSADLSHARLRDTDLREAQLVNADLSGAHFIDANLSKADLSGADLTEAGMTLANISGTRFVWATLTKTSFYLRSGVTLNPADWVGAKGLATVALQNDATLIIFTSLREELKKAGFRQEERAITAALRRNSLRNLDPLERTFQRVAFDFPVEYGNSPGRALKILLCGILLFSLPYSWVMLRVSNRKVHRGAIWKIWHPDRVLDRDSSPIAPVRLVAGPVGAFGYGLYFSLLSAFHFGWRDLNVGNWITRIQPREYSLRPTGWVRAVSGIQSLLSVYLLALWALSYFGRPFE